jgi:hypothetical protein
MFEVLRRMPRTQKSKKMIVVNLLCRRQMFEVRRRRMPQTQKEYENDRCERFMPEGAGGLRPHGTEHLPLAKA